MCLTASRFSSQTTLCHFSVQSLGLVKPLTVSVLIMWNDGVQCQAQNLFFFFFKGGHLHTSRHVTRITNVFLSVTQGGTAGIYLAGAIQMGDSGLPESSIWPNKDGNCSTFITLTNYNLRRLFVTSLCIIWIFGQPQNIYIRFKYSLQPILIISNIHAWTVMLKKSLDHEKGEVNSQCMSGLCNTNQYKHAQSFISHLKGYALQTFWSYNSSNLHNQQLTGGKKTGSSMNPNLLRNHLDVLVHVCQKPSCIY